jgi:hypothetical protein
MKIFRFLASLKVSVRMGCCGFSVVLSKGDNVVFYLY